MMLNGWLKNTTDNETRTIQMSSVREASLETQGNRFKVDYHLR